MRFHPGYVVLGSDAGDNPIITLDAGNTAGKKLVISRKPNMGG